MIYTLLKIYIFFVFYMLSVTYHLKKDGCFGVFSGSETDFHEYMMQQSRTLNFPNH